MREEVNIENVSMNNRMSGQGPNKLIHFSSAETNNMQIEKSTDSKLWACLLHLSFNFAGGIHHWGGLREEFEPDMSTWDTAIDKMAAKGINMVLLNLDDSVLWDSHPEIALKNAWTPERLRVELNKIREKGIEPIPLLNFAATHDAWLGEYAKMVSTPKYYQVCSNLIAEAIDIFDGPRLIHFGMDEEDIHHQRHFDYVVIRNQERWWADLYFYIGEAFKKGVRPWVWSDYMWHHPDEFFRMMPKSVLQSNWYYGETFGIDETAVKAYLDLEREGYDQVPTGSFHARPANNFKATNHKNIGKTVQLGMDNIADERLLGFMQTFWMPTTKEFEHTIIKAIDLMGDAKKKFTIK